MDATVCERRESALLILAMSIRMDNLQALCPNTRKPSETDEAKALRAGQMIERKRIEMEYLEWILNTDVVPLGHYQTEADNKTIRKSPTHRLICKDGQSVSVQTGEALYCEPRGDYAPWEKVECGYPTCIPPISWRQYAEEWNKPLMARLSSFWWGIKMSAEADFNYKEGGNKYINAIGGALRGLRREWKRLIAPVPCFTIYPWIPVELVKDFIAIHGGEDTEACFAQFDDDPRLL